MAKPMLSAEALSQDPGEGSSHLYKQLVRHLSSPEIVECRVAAAYASWGGLSLVSQALEEFLQRGKRLQTVFGIGNSVTTPDALLYALYLRTRYPNLQRARTFEWEFGNSEFHPKYYEFRYVDRVVTFVGSSNLTNGGLAFNHELSVAVTAPHSDPLSRSCERWWNRLWRKSRDLTPQAIRSMRKENSFGIEPDPDKSSAGARFIKMRLRRAKIPLFQHLLDDEPTPKIRHQLLAEADSLTEKPAKLYLEILKHETGGGHQIQLPVASLGAFFGVGKGDTKPTTFRFPQADETTEVNLTHFGNNTHRVRLRPLKDIPRPAILVFERVPEPNTFDCRIVPPSQYRSTLQRKCPEQTREDSRRWGLE